MTMKLNYCGPCFCGGERCMKSEYIQARYILQDGGHFKLMLLWMGLN